MTRYLGRVRLGEVVVVVPKGGDNFVVQSTDGNRNSEHCAVRSVLSIQWS